MYLSLIETDRNKLTSRNMTPQPVIYLVDDDEDDVYLARLTFSMHFPEWNLTSFEDGQALIDSLSLNPTQKLPDLIILDLNMPRLTGYETLVLLKRHKRWKSARVAILSTSSNPDDEQRSKALGACAFLTKPATVGQLAHLILEGKAVCEAQR